MKCSVAFGFNPTHCTAVFRNYNSIFAHYLGLVLGLGLDLGLELSGLGLGLRPLASRCLASLTSLATIS